MINSLPYPQRVMVSIWAGSLAASLLLSMNQINGKQWLDVMYEGVLMESEWSNMRIINQEWNIMCGIQQQLMVGQNKDEIWVNNRSKSTMMQQSSPRRTISQAQHFITTAPKIHQDALEGSPKPQSASTKCLYKTLDTARWRQIALRMKNQPSLIPRYQLDYFTSTPNSPLFDMFVNKLKEYNKKILSVAPTKTEQEAHDFIFNHLKSISRQPKHVQSQLLNKLLSWYQQSIKPKPLLVDYIRKLRKRQHGLRKKIETEDNDIRKEFKTNFMLDLNNFYRKNIGNSQNGNGNQIRRVLNSINRKQTESNRKVEDGTVVRKGVREEYNIKTWRDKGEKDSRANLYSAGEWKRVDENKRVAPIFQRTLPKGKAEMTKVVRGRGKTSGSKHKTASHCSIIGLTLLKSPFEKK